MSLTPREQIEPYIAFAFVEFGMSEDKFLAQTPKQWEQVMEAWHNKEQRANRRVARLCAVMAGGSEDDYMPKEHDDSEQSPEEMFATLQSIAPK